MSLTRNTRLINPPPGKPPSATAWLVPLESVRSTGALLAGHLLNEGYLVQAGTERPSKPEPMPERLTFATPPAALWSHPGLQPADLPRHWRSPPEMHCPAAHGLVRLVLSAAQWA